MQIIVEVPGKLPDAVHCTPQQFEQEAKMAMAVKLYEMNGSLWKSRCALHLLRTGCGTLECITK